MRAFADIVVARIEKKGWHAQGAAIARRLGVVSVGRMVHVPRRRAVEAVALERRDIGAQFLFADDVGVALNVGQSAATKQPTIAPRGRGDRRLALTRWVALSKR